MPISSSPRFKFHGAGISGAPGQRAPGADTSSYNSERSCATDISHNGDPPEYQLDVVSSVSSAGRENTEGGCGPAGRRAHQVLLHVYLPTAEATKNGGAGLDL
jgi:hypothetical protein